MSKKKILGVALFFLVFILLLNIKSYAGTQKWKSIDYDVTVNSDGSMDVVETWNIKISETNTLFKDFKLDSSKYSGITNVNVSKIDEDGVERSLQEIYEEQYHVDSGCFYALALSKYKFEIAWNVGLDDSTATRIYKLYYTIEDAVKVYNDCTELYWQFLGTDNRIPGKNVTGTIKLPKEVSDIEKLRVWAHGDLTGNIERTAKDLVSFSIDSLSEGTMIEVRIVTEENIYDNVYNTINKDKFESILAQEQKWADEANQERIYSIIAVVTVICGNALIILITIFRVIIINKKGNKLKEQYAYPDPNIEYFREIPDEPNATPARASYLYYYQDNTSVIGMNLPKIFAATILDLSLKNLVEFEPIDKNEVKIILTENSKKVELTKDEEIIYEILKGAISSNKNGYITTKEFSKYAKKHYDKVYGKLQKLEKIVKTYENECGNFDQKRYKLTEKWRRKKTFNIVMLVILLFISPIAVFMFSLYILLIANIVVYGNNVDKITLLSQKGDLELHQWKGLKKYMEEYSLLKDKQVPDIVLWEKFLVYATTFGISREVIKQLKVVHPEMFMEENQTGTSYSNGFYRYTYWNIISNTNYGVNCFNSLNSGLERVYKDARSAYNVAHSSSSSGSGGGGGFSGGGGGRRWRRRLRRSLKFINFTIKRLIFNQICSKIYKVM